MDKVKRPLVFIDTGDKNADWLKQGKLGEKLQKEEQEMDPAQWRGKPMPR